MSKKTEGVLERDVDFPRVDAAAGSVRRWIAGKASTAGVAALLAELTAAELAIVAGLTRQPIVRLEDVARAGGAQLLT